MTYFTVFEKCKLLASVDKHIPQLALLNSF